MKIEKSQPAYHQSYKIIRDMIISGALPSGTKLVEEKLASELGVSRTPIRESIRKLEQEGFIHKKMVVEPTEQDLLDMYEIRMLLEGQAAQHAANVLSSEEHDILLNCIKIGKTGNLDEIMEANSIFHDTIIQAKKNKVMIKIIDEMRSIILLFRSKVVYHSRPSLIAEHEEIYQAILAKDGQSAKRLMEQHLKNDREFCLQLLKNKKPSE